MGEKSPSARMRCGGSSSGSSRNQLLMFVLALARRRRKKKKKGKTMMKVVVLGAGQAGVLYVQRDPTWGWIEQGPTGRSWRRLESSGLDQIAKSVGAITLSIYGFGTGLSQVLGKSPGTPKNG